MKSSSVFLTLVCLIVISASAAKEKVPSIIELLHDPVATYKAVEWCMGNLKECQDTPFCLNTTAAFGIQMNPNTYFEQCYKEVAGKTVVVLHHAFIDKALLQLYKDTAEATNDCKLVTRVGYCSENNQWF